MTTANGHGQSESSSAQPAQDVPGRHASCLSLAPLREFGEFIETLADYISSKRIVAGGAPVFKIHAGLRSVVLTDHASGRFFIAAGRDLLRRERHARFGPVAVRHELTGGCGAALISAGDIHDRGRAFAADVLRHRADAFGPAMRDAITRGLSSWAEIGRVPLKGELQRVLSRFAFRWILDQTPDDDDVRAWQDNITTLVTDSCVANLVARFKLPKITPEAIAAGERLTRSARSSALLSRYMEIAREHGLDDELEVTRQLVFLCCFNIGGGLARFFLPSLARVAACPEARAALKQDLNGWDPEGGDLLDRPYLDALLHECLRMFPRPRFLHRKAVRDFTLPSGAGAFRIRRGDLLVALQPYIHRDPAVFREPDSFRPQRFIEAPQLKDAVFTFGWTPGTEHAFHCLGARHARAVWKHFVARMFTSYTWHTPSLEFDINHFYDFAPDDVALEAFTTR